MAFAKFEENRFRIDGEITENHAILVNLTAIVSTIFTIGPNGTIQCISLYIQPRYFGIL